MFSCTNNRQWEKDNKMRALRPATAGSNRTAFEQRPLGRSPLPVRLQTAITTSSIQSQIAALKGEILMLQHRFQETRFNGECNAEMESLERKLMQLSPIFPDDGSTNLDVKCSLLEIMLEQVKSISAAVLERCDAPVDASPVPSRSHNFLRLVEFVASLADRKRVWDERVADEVVHKAAESADAAPLSGDDLQARRDMTTLDLAMNEPTAAEVRKLVQEQKQLQESLKAVLAKQAKDEQAKARRSLTPGALQAAAPHVNGSVPSIPIPGSTVSPTTQQLGGATFPSSSGLPDHNQAISALQARLDSLMHENAEQKKRMIQLEEQLRDSSSSEKIEMDEVPVDVARRVRGLAFGSDYPRLLELGVTVPTKQILSDENSQLFAGRVNGLLLEVSAGYSQLMQQSQSVKSASPAGAKDKQKEAGGGAPLVTPGSTMEGLLWSTLHQQCSILTDVLNKTKKHSNDLKNVVERKETEIVRLQRVVATLEQRIQLIKVQASKSTLTQEAEMEKLQKDTQYWRKLYDDLVVAQSSKVSRIVNAKGQVATAEEREKTLKEEVANRQQSIGDLTDQLKALKIRLEEEQTASAAVARERKGLIQARDAEAVKVSRLQVEAKDREEALQMAKEQILLLKKEIREKNVAETEMQQKAWKLEVELHIAQNVITELRQREQELSKIARDAESCREELQEEVYRLRDDIAFVQSSMTQKVEDAKQELLSAKSMLKDERQKLMAQEKEVERLRIVDLKMESLEQNFTNYAASKIAQREAGEEEERMLGECLEALDKDPFIVPSDKQGEAQLQLYIRELQSAKEQHEADQRVRSRNAKDSVAATKDEERSNKKQLVLLLQLRLTEVQLYSCNYRLKQMTLERENRNNNIEIKQLQASQEALLQELSQVRLQCEALAHRNSELEIERKQFIKQRSQTETEVKNLKANAQRLRVSHDEQEKLLVDMGTKLQTARMSADSDKPITALSAAVIGVE